MLSAHRADSPRNTAVVSGQVQDVVIRVACQHPAVQDRVHDFLRAMVARQGEPPRDTLDFVLDLLDGGETSSPSGQKAPFRFVNVACFREEGRAAFYTPDGSRLMADLQSGRAWGHVTERLLRSIVYAFTDLMMAPLMEMLKHRGFCGLHAAALSSHGAGYLFPGNADAGKTTVALSLIRQGFQCLADDKVLLRTESTGVLALAFTRTFNINPDIGRHYPELAFVENLSPLPLTVKRPVDISRVYPTAFVTASWPRYIIHIEKIGIPPSRIRRLSSNESFRRILHQTVLSMEKRIAAKQVDLLRDLVCSTDSFLLSNGPDLYAASDRVAELVTRL